jgi:hypothetical protein
MGITDPTLFERLQKNVSHFTVLTCSKLVMPCVATHHFTSKTAIFLDMETLNCMVYYPVLHPFL